MTTRWDAVLTVTLMACALIVTTLFVRREFLAPSLISTELPQKSEFLEGWRAHLDQGFRVGSPTAPVQLIEFLDFECPYCASFHESLKALRERYPRQVALSYVHFPLPMHRFAEPAARAAECAAGQGRFESMADRLFEQQSTFGLKPWSEFGLEAGVPDRDAFESCIKNAAPLLRILAGRRLAEELHIKRTPTLIVNGWKLGTLPSPEELDHMVKSVLAGGSPIVAR